MPDNGPDSSHTTQTDFENRTFLMIDDEQVILSCMSLLLEARGHKVFTAGSVAAATQVMEQRFETIDCLIIDFSMPDCNGLQLLNQFRSIGWKHPAILCSRHTIDLGDYPDAQYWPEFILAKPYHFDRLSEAISVALKSPD